MNGYRCYWRGKERDEFAHTSLQAQTQAARAWKVKKSYEVTVILFDKGDGAPVIHKPQDVLPGS